MNIAQLTAEHYYKAFYGDNWSEIDFKEVLDGVSFTEALSITPASPNSIAAIIYHVTFYSKTILQRLQGNNPKINDANGFDMPEIKTESGWQTLKQLCFEAANDLTTAIKNIPDDKWEEPIFKYHDTFYKTIAGVTEHAYYHLGQIVILKKVLRNNVHL